MGKYPKRNNNCKKKLYTALKICKKEEQTRYQTILNEIRSIQTEPPAIYNALIRAIKAQASYYPLIRQNTKQPAQKINTQTPTTEYAQAQSQQPHHLNDQITEDIIAIAEAERKMHELKKEYTPYKREKVQEYARQLSARIDFDAIIAQYTHGEKNISFPTFLDSIRQAYCIREVEYRLTKESSVEYNQLTQYEEILEINEKRLKAHGFLREPNDPENTTYTPNFEGEAIKAARKEAIKEGRKIINELEANRRIIQIYKDKRYREKEVEDILESLESQNIYTEQETTREIQEIIDYDPRFIQAAKRFFVQKRNKLAQQGKLRMTNKEKQTFISKARKKNAQEIGARITITDTYQKQEDVIEIITREEIQNILTLLPPALLEGITEIKITQEPNQKKLGLHRRTYNQIEDDIRSTIEIYIPRFAQKSATNQEKRTQKIILVQTLIHECAHPMHTKLPLHELEEWERVIKEEKRDITWYVQKKRKENSPQTNIEDFAESVRIYMTNPAVLLICAPKRFRYISNLMKTYMPPKQWQHHKMRIKKKIKRQNMKWKKSGYKAEDIKRMYVT